MIRTTVRKSRRVRRCEGTCEDRRIMPGEQYLEHVMSPNHGDIGGDHWWRTAECAQCAARCGRPIDGPVAS